MNEVQPKTRRSPKRKIDALREYDPYRARALLTDKEREKIEGDERLLELDRARQERRRRSI